MKVYDIFTFYKEFDLLELRLSELRGVVDKFVICEGVRTFVGNPKPMFFEKVADKYRDLDITYLVYDGEYDMNRTDYQAAWKNDFAQRNHLVNGILGAADDDVISFGDMDEIPNPDAIKRFISSGQGVKALKNNFFYYTMNCLQNVPCCAAGVFRMGAFRHAQKQDGTKPTLQEWRAFIRTIPDPIQGGGCHFSYLMTPEEISQKLKNFAHTEFSGDKYTNLENITNAIKSGTDLLHRRGINFRYLTKDECYKLPGFPRRALEDPRYAQYLDFGASRRNSLLRA